MKRLTIILGSGAVQNFDLEKCQKNRIYIGRSREKNDICLASNIISSSHGVFLKTADGISYTDLNSRNGTYVESRKGRALLKNTKQAVVLYSGDMIRILSRKHPESSVLIIYEDEQQEKIWDKYFLGKKEIKIGRGSGCDIIFPEPYVSRNQCGIIPSDDGYELLNYSRNGTLVNGKLIHDKHILREQDVIQIYQNILIYTDGKLFYKIEADGIQVELQHIDKFVGREKKQILRDVSCQIGSNEFIAIIGGSGAGKTTLMNVMNGFDDDFQGKVYYNGIDLKKNKEWLKNVMGYVPQEDIIYENLTLYKMLYYTAKIKFPKDMTSGEIRQKVLEAIRVVELDDHKDTLVRKLSGGQKKRASIAVELLGEPKIFFLDEPTSGLDPGTEQNLMHSLRSLAKNQKTTVIMVTHTTQNIHLCDKIIFMGNGGRLCFYGSPDQAKMFFDTDDFTDAYIKTSKDAEFWKEQYDGSFVHQDSYPEENEENDKFEKEKAPLGRQFASLLGRSFESLWNEKNKLILLLLQPALISLLIKIVSDEDVFKLYESTRNILFALTCAGIWIGLFNSIQEICRERKIVKREYMSGLNLGLYIIAKFCVQIVISLLQAALISGIFFTAIGTPDQDLGFFKNAPAMFLTTWITIITAAALGFLVSASVKSGDKAMVIAPFLLILQLLFSGVIFELEGIGKRIADITISKWSIGAYGTIANLNSLDLKMQKDFPMIEHETEALYKFAENNLMQKWAVLAAMLLVCLIASGVILRRVAKDKR